MLLRQIKKGKEMKDKIILLTGANGGLGRAFIEKLVTTKPKKLYCAVRDLSSCGDIEKINSCIELVELDITDSKSIQKLTASIESLDILINNAGISKNQRLFDDSFEEIEINLKGTMNLTKAFFKKLQHKNAKIVNVTSALALVNLPVMADYCISKAALHSFTQALRAEMANYGCEVYEVLPGPIDTRLTANSPMEKAKPENVVSAILEGIGKKECEIFPDIFAKMIKQRLEVEPEKVVKEFAMSVQG